MATIAKKSKKSKKRLTTPKKPTQKTKPLTLGDQSPVLSVTCRFCGAELILGSPGLRLFSRREGVEGRPCRHAAAVTVRLAVSTCVLGGSEFQSAAEYEWVVPPTGKGDQLVPVDQENDSVAATIAQSMEKEYEFIRELQIVRVDHPSQSLTTGYPECWVTTFVTVIFTEDQRRFLDIVEKSFPGVFDIWDKK